MFPQADFYSYIRLGFFSRIFVYQIDYLLKRGEKWFPEKLRKILTESFRSELVLLRGGLPSEIVLQGKASSPKLCITIEG